MASSLDHSAFRAGAEGGTIAVGVEPSIARRFFTDSSFAPQRSLVGEPLYTERLIVGGAYYLAPAILLASLGCAWLAFGWWSILAIPLSVVSWLFYGGTSSVGRPRLWPLVLTIGLVSGWNSVAQSHAVYTWVTLVLVAMLFSRITYRCASGLFRLLIIRNGTAYSQFRGSAVFVRE